MNKAILKYYDETDNPIAVVSNIEDPAQIIKAFQVMKDNKIVVEFNKSDNSLMTKDNNIFEKEFFVSEIIITLPTKMSLFCINIYLEE